MLYGQTNTITTESGEVLNGFAVSIPNPPKSAIIRLPNAVESTKYFVKYMERFASNQKKNAPDLDRTIELDLFYAIRLDKGEPFDEYEAEFIVSRITGSIVTSSEKSADGFTINIKTPFGEVSHTLRQPTFKQMAEFRKASSNPTGFSLHPTTSLYDSLLVKMEGYVPTFGVSDVPPEHKSLCVTELTIAHTLIDPIQIDPNE
jgi:hypothetical protein